MNRGQSERGVPVTEEEPVASECRTTTALHLRQVRVSLGEVWMAFWERT